MAGSSTCLALFQAGTVTAGSTYSLWARAPRTVAGLLVDGEADIAGDAEPVTRVQWGDAADRLVSQR